MSCCQWLWEWEVAETDTEHACRSPQRTKRLLGDSRAVAHGEKGEKGPELGLRVRESHTWEARGEFPSAGGLWPLELLISRRDPLSLPASLGREEPVK